MEEILRALRWKQMFDLERPFDGVNRSPSRRSIVQRESLALFVPLSPLDSPNLASKLSTLTLGIFFGVPLISGPGELPSYLR